MVFVCVSAIALTATKIVPVAPIRNAAGTVIVPLQNGINRIGSWMTDRQASFRNARKLAEENEALKEKVAQLEEENLQLQMGQEELLRLRNLYALDEQLSAYDKIGAEVIAKEAGNWFHRFTINRGSEDGVEVDMNVVCGEGLVGIVTDVGKHWATVRAIIDSDSNVSGMTVSSLDSCIVSGDLKLMDRDRLSFGQMNTENEISAGEKIVTSNISDKYLEGILIGYVDEVTEDSNHLTKTGYLIPAVDFSHLEEVLVITEKKESGGGE